MLVPIRLRINWRQIRESPAWKLVNEYRHRLQKSRIMIAGRVADTLIRLGIRIVFPKLRQTGANQSPVDASGKTSGTRPGAKSALQLRSELGARLSGVGVEFGPGIDPFPVSPACR